MKIKNLAAALCRLHKAGFKTTSKSAALLILHEAPAPMNQTHVALALGVSTAAVTGIADSLEALGLAERSTTPADRRIVNLWITDRGREEVRKLADADPTITGNE